MVAIRQILVMPDFILGPGNTQVLLAESARAQEIRCLQNYWKGTEKG